MKKPAYNIAIVGATGAVGTEMLKVLAEQKFPIATLKLLASGKSAGQKLKFNNQELTVEELKENSFENIDIALFSAGGSVSEHFAPLAAKAGAVVVDNTSCFRMDPDVPLVVPEVNPNAIAAYKKKGIIANPNCSTIQMVVALKPIHDVAKIKRIVVSTYQSTSGAGAKAMQEMRDQTEAVLQGRPVSKQKFVHQIAFNCLPHIDVFLDNGYTKEEIKMVNETRKIFEDENIQISPTCVRVPVFKGHSESVNVETEKPISVQQVRELMAKSPGVTLVDNPEQKEYPMAIHCEGKDDVFVGRIRKDDSIANGINMWIVSDNIRKGAATNAVQIAKILIEKYL